ncbi:hypothetical protein [Burkholderia sp. WAC0059]|uniref:hypothetical protein n=1 Tax=Burkholderia sp. WAC0059 TaxID=2066022 RepID=UPI0015E0C62D|nr:hypothetical protein [Burkholderia sp. WAC0059]
MLAIGGAVASILAMLQFVKDGCSREDFREHVRSVNPKLAPSSVNTNINALIAEWGVLAAEGDQLLLTSRGAAFLESEDPDDVSDWLLTQILGFDNLLYLLRQGPREHKTLIEWPRLAVPKAVLVFGVLLVRQLGLQAQLTDIFGR